MFPTASACCCKKKCRLALCNPLLISVAVTIALLVTARIDYDVYYEGAKYLSYLLTPATVCLAVPLYEKLALLRQNYKAIFAGIFAGVVTTLCSVLMMSRLFHLSHEEYVTLLPKSITTAIGMGVSEELGGYVTLTVAMIIITGIFGNVTAVAVCRLFHITDPIAKGVGIGSAAHALGTAKSHRAWRGRGRNERPVDRCGGTLRSPARRCSQTSCEGRGRRFCAVQAFCDAKSWRRWNSLPPSILITLRVSRLRRRNQSPRQVARDK